MSPQTRRGRAAPASHRKSSSARGASAATRKPAAAVEELDEQLDDEQLDDLEPLPVRPRRRRRGLARLRRTSAYRYANEAVGAYIPLIVAFVLVFGGVWAWISFGPHKATPQENWTRIENIWMPKRETARQQVSDAMSDLAGQVRGYTAYRDATRGWMGDLAAVTDWNDPKKTDEDNATVASEMENLIGAGNAQANLLDKVAVAKTSSEISDVSSDIVTTEETFDTYFGLVRYDIMGSATYTVTTGPTLALPSASANPCGSPGASGSPGSSAVASACASASASGSPRGSASPSVSTSPAISGSPSPSDTPKT